MWAWKAAVCAGRGAANPALTEREIQNQRTTVFTGLTLSNLKIGALIEAGS